MRIKEIKLVNEFLVELEKDPVEALNSSRYETILSFLVEVSIKSKVDRKEKLLEIPLALYALSKANYKDINVLLKSSRLEKALETFFRKDPLTAFLSLSLFNSIKPVKKLLEVVKENLSIQSKLKIFEVSLTSSRPDLILFFKNFIDDFSSEDSRSALLDTFWSFFYRIKGNPESEIEYELVEALVELFRDSQIESQAAPMLLSISYSESFKNKKSLLENYLTKYNNSEFFIEFINRFYAFSTAGFVDEDSRRLVSIGNLKKFLRDYFRKNANVPTASEFIGKIDISLLVKKEDIDFFKAVYQVVSKRDKEEAAEKLLRTLIKSSIEDEFVNLLEILSIIDLKSLDKIEGISSIKKEALEGFKRRLIKKKKRIL